MSTLLLCYASFLLCVASRAHAFAFCPTTSCFGQPNNIMHMRSRCRGKVGAPQATRSEEQQQGTTRAGLVRTIGASIAGTLAVNALPCAAARTREELVSLPPMGRLCSLVQLRKCVSCVQSMQAFCRGSQPAVLLLPGKGYSLAPPPNLLSLCLPHGKVGSEEPTIYLPSASMVVEACICTRKHQ